jgi:hypothetical protein
MSSPIKSEVKIAAAQDIGVRLDDLLEQARTEVAQMNGAQTGMNEGARAVAKLLTAVDSDIDNGVMDLQQAQMAKLYVNRAIAVLENLARHMGNLVLAANGKVTAFDKAVASVKTYQDAEQVRLASALAQAATEAATGATTTSHRPEKTIKQLRLDEAAVKPVPVAAPVPTPKKRGRPPKRKA